MTKLSDKDILDRLHSLPSDLPLNHLDLVAQGKIPEELKSLLEQEWIIIDPPPDREAIGPCSVNLHLGNWLELRRVPLELVTIDGKPTIRLYTYDARDSNPHLLEDERGRFKEITEHGTNIKFRFHDNETFELQPGFFLIAATRERLYVPTNFAVLLQGRSRFARKGITVELSSSRFDPGWCGAVVMEIANVGATSFNLFPGLAICAVTFERLSSRAEVPYFAKKNAAFRGQQ